MRCVAWNGVDKYLLSEDDDLARAKADRKARARVLFLSTRELGPTFNLHSIISRPGWQEKILSSEETRQMLANAGVLTPA